MTEEYTEITAVRAGVSYEIVGSISMGEDNIYFVHLSDDAHVPAHINIQEFQSSGPNTEANATARWIEFGTDKLDKMIHLLSTAKIMLEERNQNQQAQNNSLIQRLPDESI